jgi:hypothetical protein
LGHAGVKGSVNNRTARRGSSEIQVHQSRGEMMLILDNNMVLSVKELRKQLEAFEEKDLAVISIFTSSGLWPKYNDTGSQIIALAKDRNS